MLNREISITSFQRIKHFNLTPSSHKVRVIYGHTDMMGRVYYGRFYEYFESARSHFLREVGLPYTDIEKSGVFVPVIESHCEYRHPATYDDVLIVRTILREAPRAKMKIEYEVLLEKSCLLYTSPSPRD
mgnify:CR=1 FL=1